MTMLTAAQAAELLRTFDNILILTHVRPDGDTVGCAAALCAGLQQSPVFIPWHDLYLSADTCLFCEICQDFFKSGFLVSIPDHNRQISSSAASAFTAAVITASAAGT